MQIKPSINSYLPHFRYQGSSNMTQYIVHSARNTMNTLCDDECWNLSEIRKYYSDKNDMDREWYALTDCAGFYTQKVIKRDRDTQVIHFHYDSQAKPLSTFTVENAPSFIWVLPHIIKAVQHCHHNGWVHGDIKPSNILFLPYLDSVQLIDFGASQRIGTPRQALLNWQATRSFATDEQWYGKGTVRESDDWFAVTKMIEQCIVLTSDPKIQRQAVSIRNSLTRWV